MSKFSSNFMMLFGFSAGFLAVAIPAYGVNGLETVISMLPIIGLSSLIGGISGFVTRAQINIVNERLASWKEIKREIEKEYS